MKHCPSGHLEGILFRQLHLQDISTWPGCFVEILWCCEPVIQLICSYFPTLSTKASQQNCVFQVTTPTPGRSSRQKDSSQVQLMSMTYKVAVARAVLVCVCVAFEPFFFWLVVSTHLKNISQIGSFPQVGV